MQPLEIPAPNQEQFSALEMLYHTTRDVRLRTRAQMILLAVEKHLTATAIAEIVRESEATVRRWMKRYRVEGVEGLQDRPRSGAPSKVTDASRALVLQVVRQRPRSLGQPYSLWTDASAGRLFGRADRPSRRGRNHPLAFESC